MGNRQLEQKIRRQQLIAYFIGQGMKQHEVVESLQKPEFSQLHIFVNGEAIHNPDFIGNVFTGKPVDKATICRDYAEIQGKTAKLQNPLRLVKKKDALTQINTERLLDNQSELYKQFQTMFRTIRDLENRVASLEKTRDFSQVSQHKAGFVYIIQAITPHNYYKIGLAANPKSCIEKLEVKLPFPVDTIHLIETDDMLKTEKRIHRLFADKRAKGEWFHLSENDISWLKTLASVNESNGWDAKQSYEGFIKRHGRYGS